MNYKELRRMMVDTQIVPRGISDERVLEALLKVPRHLFMEETIRYKAYDDMALPIGEGQTISQPYMVAVMTELLELTGDEKVLEVGGGSGYQAAILGELSREVYSVERIEALALRAERLLREMGYDNIHVSLDDGTGGLAEKSPFDRIIVTAGTPHIPEPLKEQLADGGILLLPVGGRHSQQLIRMRKREGEFSQELHTPCVFVPLIGKHGWAQ